jgi:hypothetical protein
MGCVQPPRFDLESKHEIELRLILMKVSYGNVTARAPYTFPIAVAV